MKDVVLGLDIGGTYSKMGLIDAEGRVVAAGKFSTHSQEPIEVFLDELATFYHEMEKLADEPVRLVAVGCCAPNANQFDGTMVHPHNFRWGEIVPLRERLIAQFNRPVVVANDANASAVGEQRFGAAKGFQSFIVLTLGTGLGSGIILNGELLLGKNGLAGEMGHTVAKLDGRQCNCGKRGCLETYASATGIRRTIFKLLADMNELSPLRQQNYNDLTAKAIAEAALGGDEIAIEAFAYTGIFLGTKMGELISIFNPEAIILAGGLAKAGDLLLQPALAHMDAHTFPPLRGTCAVKLSQIEGANAAVLGVGAMGWYLVDPTEDLVPDAPAAGEL